jgi:hypothetical protein
MARSLAAFLFLKEYGYKPNLVLEIDFGRKEFYNCHCWVTLNPHQVQHEYKESIISFNRNTIILDTTNGVKNGEHNSDRLLQSELPLLFYEKDDGR